SVNTTQHLTIQNILNRGIIAGALSIENQGQIENVFIDINNINNQGYIRNVYIGIWGERNGKIELDSFKNSGIIYNTDNNGVLFEGKDIQIGKFINTGIIVADKNDKDGVAIGKKDTNNGNTTINLFLNEGLIGNDKSRFGVRFYGGKNQNGSNLRHQSTINHFINTGTLHGKDTGLSFSQSTLINFVNTGLIKAETKRAVEMYSNSTITNFINSGTIENKNRPAVFLENSTITNFLNTGTIKSSSGSDVKNDDNSNGDKIVSGILIKSGTLNNLINTGLILGFSGIRTYSSMDYLINTGTIQAMNSSNNNSENYAAIDIRKQNGGSITLKNLINTGSLDSQYQGILITTGATITNLYNNGTIKAQKDGITFFGDNGSGNKGEIDNIIIGKQGSIDAQKNAINVDVIGDRQNTQPVSIGLINIQEGAKVS
ncbi:hypothetical protein DZC71_07635, partial [Campylobacter hepaticus]